MAYEQTWLYKNAQFEESYPNGCIVAFNPTHSPLLQRQAEAIAKELGYDTIIYDNFRTDQKILEAAEAAYRTGYDDLLVLTETDKMNYAERLVRQYFDFTEVQAFSEVVSSKAPNPLQESFANKQRLHEALPTPAPAAKPVTKPVPQAGRALLLVAALNVNPPTKGSGQMIQEILGLEKNAAALVAKYCPDFTTWDRKTVYTRIYLRAPSAMNSLDAGTRVHLLADSDGFDGLYNAAGCSTFKVSPPITGEPGSLWIPGDRRSNPSTKIHEFTDSLGVGGTIVFAPQSQANAVQGDFRISAVVPLATSYDDNPREDVIQTAVALGNEYSTKALADKAKAGHVTQVASVKPTHGDLFMFQLLGIAKSTGGRPSDATWTVTDKMDKGSKGYFAGIWEAIPEGDKAFLKEVGEGTGIGDIVSIVNSARKISKAALGIKDKEEKKSERWKEIEEKLGFGIAEVISDPRYKQLKAEFDLAD